ncbi:MAG: hypothetical protein Q9171_007252 [Xanthocarpia ochracea]
MNFCPLPLANTSQSNHSGSPKSLVGRILSPDTRAQAIFRNVRIRRGQDVDVIVPVYPDNNTADVFRDMNKGTALHGRNGGKNRPASIFGISPDSTICMTTCSLQVTMQPQDISEARKLYDQLIPLSPIMLALTAATMIWKDVLADTDCRWDVMGLCFDDRTVDEISDKSIRGETFRVRHLSNDLYMSLDPRLLDRYHDAHSAIDDGVREELLHNGMDERLANHFAHLFARDPLVVFSKDAESDATEDTALFEAVQSTIYNTVRFKPPPSFHSDIGWRVEFRPMEVQMTDFENAAFVVFIMLLSRTILHFDLDFYMPISMIDENMEKANRRDAINREHFRFRADPLLGSKLTPTVTKASPEMVLPSDTSSPTENISDPESTHGSVTPDESKGSSTAGPLSSTTSLSSSISSTDNPPVQHSAGEVTASSKRTLPDVELLTDGQPTKRSRPTEDIRNSDEEYNPSHHKDDNNEFPLQTLSALMNGSEAVDPTTTTNFPGLIPLITRYLDETNTLDSTARAKVDEYLRLIGARASGKAWTAAKWQREFVRAHGEYRGDSIVNEKVMYDLLRTVGGMDGRREKGKGRMFDF